MTKPTADELAAALADLVKRHDFRGLDRGHGVGTPEGVAWITARNLVRAWEGAK